MDENKTLELNKEDLSIISGGLRDDYTPMESDDAGIGGGQYEKDKNDTDGTVHNIPVDAIYGREVIIDIEPNTKACT